MPGRLSGNHVIGRVTDLCCVCLLLTKLNWGLMFFVPMPTLLFAAYDHRISHDISWLKDKYISINQRFTYLLSMSKSVGKLTSVCSIFEKYFFSRCFHWNIDIQECIIAYWKEKLRIMHWKSFRNFVFKYFIITKFFSSCFFEWSFFLSFALGYFNKIRK